MRTFFLLLFVGTTLTVQAQTSYTIKSDRLIKEAKDLNMAVAEPAKPKLNIKDFKKALEAYKQSKTNRLRYTIDESSVNKALPLFIAGTQPGVYRLKDGMPCIVPDTKDIAQIPNTWKGNKKTPYPATIPNSGKKLYPVLPPVYKADSK